MPSDHESNAFNDHASPAAGSSKAIHAARTGVWLVLGIVLLAAGLAVFAVWFQWGQTRRCLEFFGAAGARRIQTAERVELWLLSAEGDTIRVRQRLDVSRAPGLVHLRRGLIEDVNYAWIAPGQGGAEPGFETAGGGRLPASAWDLAIAFEASPQAEADQVPVAPASDKPALTVLAFDLDGPGAMTVVGQPGRVGLGRLTSGLRTWVDDAKKRGLEAGKTGL